MTTEEVLYKAYGRNITPSYEMLAAMSDYAQQMAIGFRNWEPPVGSYTDEELYKLYLSQIK